MMWNESVVIGPAGAGHRVQPWVQDSGSPDLRRPRGDRRAPAGGERSLVTGAPAHRPAEAGIFHVAALVRSDEELSGAAARWTREGIDAGDLVVIGGTPSFQQAVAEDFGDVDRVWFDDRVRPNGRRGPDALAAVLAMSEQALQNGSGRLRVLAQVDQPDDGRVVREFACLESAANLMPIAAPTATLCIYDERRLPQ